MAKRLLAIVAATAFVAGLSGSALAQSNTPGHLMQENGSVSGSAGASGYTPGHRMQENGSVQGSAGASGYAPGHATTGATVDSDTKVKAGGAKANIGVGAKGHIK